MELEPSANFDHEPVRRLPFTTAPCRCVKRHCPRPLTTELHHVFPESWQRRVFGTVRFKETIPLCGSSHNTVHTLLDAMVRGVAVDRRRNDYLEELAWRGWRMYQDALAERV